MASILGIDVGGTFTDFVMVSPAGVRVHKRPSTPDDPLGAGLTAIGPPPNTAVVHGTPTRYATVPGRMQYAPTRYRLPIAGSAPHFPNAPLTVLPAALVAGRSARAEQR